MDTKRIRTEIDAFINTTPMLQTSREISLYHTSLQRSFMWLGESLKESGSTSPYTESENPSSTVIEPTADHTNNVINFDHVDNETDGSHLSRVKYLRKLLEFMIKAFKDSMNDVPINSSGDYMDCVKQSFFALKEAKMWLGWELARIKKES